MSTLTKQIRWAGVNGEPEKTRQLGWVNVPVLTTNIFAVATNRTNIHNKKGSVSK
jgi:hypothetical protein